jgi:cystathionine beta-lyase
MMRRFGFDTPVPRAGTSSVKWDKYQGRDIIPMGLADMDFRSPPAVINALRERVDHGVFGYSHVPVELVEVVCATLWQEYGWQIHPEWLVWLPGLVTGLNVACRAVGENGDVVMTAVPVYPPFLSAPQLSGRALTTVELVKDEGRWTFDFDRLARAATDRTRLLMLCNPHNPVGRAYSREELLELVALCEQHEMVICSDEIHCGLILDTDKTHIPTATLGPEVADRTITLMAPSKTFNIPGLGCGFAVISNEQLRKRFTGAMERIVPHVNVMGYVAALAAYRHGREWHRAVLDYLRTNRDAVARAIGDMVGLRTTHVEATYLAWIDTSEVKFADPVAFFEAAGVGLFDGRDFGGKGFVRLNFGCPLSRLEEALRRMKMAMDSYDVEAVGT